MRAERRNRTTMAYFEGNSCTETVEAQPNTNYKVTALACDSTDISRPQTFADGTELTWNLVPSITNTGTVTVTFTAPTGSTIYNIALTVTYPTSDLTTSWTGNVCTVTYDRDHSGDEPELEFAITLTTG